jgi:DNA-binding CsgD family transcriptional regulator
MDTAAVPLVYQWLKPLMTVSDPAVFATWQLAAPRVQGALNTMLGELNAQAFPALETDNWVVEGTPKEQQWARLRMAQVVIFLLVAAGLVAVFVKQRNGDVHDDMATTDTPGILSQTETDLSQSEVEACIGKSQVSPPEIRAAVNAVELLTLPLLAQKAAAVGTLPQVWGQLTQKERQVALLLARRVPPQQISEILRCSPAYVYNMKSELRKKWGLHDSTELDRALLRLI